MLTHRPGETVGDVTFLSSSVEEAIATAKDAAGAKDVGVFGAEVAAQCIGAGLVDEIFVHLVPVGGSSLTGPQPACSYLTSNLAPMGGSSAST